jgi:tRNA G18 (ribose-2'-O)-methylase SpoU
MIAILNNIRSAHNVGSIIRTCDALGIKRVWVCGITPGLENNKVLKTSLGAEKNVEIKSATDIRELILEIKNKYKIYGLELSDGAVPIGQVKLDDKCALVVGNEVSGIDEEILSLCDQIFYIPMKGIKESLNVSVAFGIAAYELTKGCKR